jgi:ketosteroid isomerase-like protein
MAANSPETCTTDFTAALIRRDINAALSLITDDVVFFYSNGSAILGKQEFSSNMTRGWNIVSDYEYSTIDLIWINRSTAAASVIYNFIWPGMSVGANVSGSGRGTRVLSNDGSGWRIAHGHLSTGQWKPR